jgi:hypothetical protein
VSLRFGVGDLDGAATGHCWIEYDGQALAERRDPRPVYVETWSIQPR